MKWTYNIYKIFARYNLIPDDPSWGTQDMIIFNACIPKSAILMQQNKCMISFTLVVYIKVDSYRRASVDVKATRHWSKSCPGRYLTWCYWRRACFRPWRAQHWKLSSWGKVLWWCSSWWASHQLDFLHPGSFGIAEDIWENELLFIRSTLVGMHTINAPMSSSFHSKLFISTWGVESSSIRCSQRVVGFIPFIPACLQRRATVWASLLCPKGCLEYQHSGVGFLKGCK